MMLYRLLSVMLFALLLVPAVRADEEFRQMLDDRLRYFLCLACAILLVLFMTGTLLRGMSFVAGRGTPGDLFNFGFAQIFYGSHSPEVPREWMFSFTTPQANDATGVTGFYAPLWVMLLAVIGASLMTLSLLVAEIVKPVREEDASVIRQRTQTIVMHQFFIQFSPLGAIFVYQSLLAAKAAEEPIAVALAALGAGAAINLVLRNAVNASARLFSSSWREASDDESSSRKNDGGTPSRTTPDPEGNEGKTGTDEAGTAPEAEAPSETPSTPREGRD